MIINPSNAANSVKEYYFSKKLDEINTLKKAGKEIINLGIGNPDLPPPKSVVNALIRSSANDKNHGYQMYKGTDKLRKAFSDWYNTYFKVFLNPIDEILPLQGSKAGIIQISLAFLNPGDEVLVPNPGYPTYKSNAEIVGAKPIFYNLTEENNWFPDFEELAKLDLSKVKIMWVNYPNMPTGKNANKQLFEKLIQFGLKNNILICNDNPYNFILNKSYLSILSVKDAFKTAIELNSLSKSHNMAGWRIGAVFGHKDYIETIQKIQSNMTSGMFLAMQEAAIDALTMNSDWYKELNEEYSIRREIIWKILDKINCNYSTIDSGMFIWAKIPKNFENSYEMSDYLLEKFGIFITPGGIFGLNGEKYLRISLCNTIEILENVLSKLKLNVGSQNS